MNTISNVLNTVIKMDDNTKKIDFSQGNNVVGKIKDKNENGTLIDVLGKDVMVPSNIEIKENVGEECLFQVERTAGDKIKLKYMSKEYSGVSSNNNRTTSLINLWNNKNIPMNKEIMDLITSIQNKGQHIENEYIDIINNTKKQLDNLFSKITDEDIIQLLNKNYNPEKITIELFEKIVSSNKLAVAGDDTKKIKKEMTKEINKEIEKYTKIFGSKEEIKSIIKKLKEKNLPITEQNIMKIRGALNKYDAIKNLQDEAILNVLRKNIELTIENIYEAKYTSGQFNSKNNTYGSVSGKQGPSITDDELRKLEPQIKNILEREKIEINDKTLKAAKTFIKNNIDIEKQSVEKYLYIKDIENKVSRDKVIEDAVNNITRDKKIDDIKLDSHTQNNNMKNAKNKKLVDNLPAIKDDHIKSLIKKGTNINLDNLERESNKLEITNDVKELSEEQNNNYITAKRQLEEIRLKMTLESANRLANNNIRIDTAPLNKIVEGLRNLEEDVLRKELSNVGIVDSHSNVEKMKDVLNTVEIAKNTSANVLGKVMQKVVDFTLKDISNEQTGNPNLNNHLQDMYDKLGTKPRADLGDSINKTFNQLETILKELGIEATNENLRAARIIAHNELEISRSNINNIKLLDQKVNMVLNRLHPSIVANMMKDNLSPIDMNIDEVIQYMEDFDELIGEDLTDKIASYIHEMDRDNSLSEKERQGMIGIYRMLNTITKSEGRAVGFLMKKDMKLSLNNLMEAAKYLRRTGGKYTDINVNIDDNFGALEELNYNSESIKKQIQEAFEKVGFHTTKNNIKLIESMEEFELKLDKDHLIDLKYLENNIKELIREVSPNSLKDILSHEGILDQPIEEVLTELDKVEEAKDIDTKQLLDQLNQIKNVNSEAIKFLQKQQLPINMKNLITINNLLQDNNELSHKLKDMMVELSELNIESGITETISNALDSLANGGNIRNIYSKIQDELKEIKGKSFGLDRKKKVEINNNLTDINRIIDMNKELERKEDYLQIPIMIGGELSQLNMYYINEEKTVDDNSLKVLLSLNTKSLGVVSAFIKVEDGAIDIHISSNIDKETKYLKQFDNQLRSIIENMGYNIKTLNYEEQKVQTPLSTNEISFNSTMGDNKQGNFEILI